MLWAFASLQKHGRRCPFLEQRPAGCSSPTTASNLNKNAPLRSSTAGHGVKTNSDYISARVMMIFCTSLVPS